MKRTENEKRARDGFLKDETEEERTNSWTLVGRRRPENCQSKVPRNEKMSRGAASQTSFLCQRPRMSQQPIEPYSHGVPQCVADYVRYLLKNFQRFR
ncbi:hypothetical protein QLX08_010955 [Tetragonisca angustula]|uniref:Uncharacterized protein n=1 Tax=Tetragonisca angustula TaxID=166442 RepID=A0AAW0ZAJ6_9HYME